MEVGMPSRTISSAMDESVARTVTELARVEDRTPSQIVNAAVRFYMQLPDAARRSVRSIEALGTAEERAEAMRSVARSLAESSFHISRPARRRANPHQQPRAAGRAQDRR